MSASQQLRNTKLTAEIFGRDFIILKQTEKSLSNKTKLHLYSKAIYEAQLDFIEEVIGTEVEILLKLNEHFSDDSLGQIDDINIPVDKKHNTYRLPIYIQENEDWNLIETATGLSKKAYLRKLEDCELQLSMLGFLPGFLYLKGLPLPLQVPRKKTPEKSVSAGSIAIGGPYLGLYSLASPGGWNVIGSCPLITTNSSDLPFVNLCIGDKIKLSFLSEKNYLALVNSPLTIKEYNELL